MTWHRLAEEDLAAAYLSIGIDSPDAAERLLDAVENSLRLLVENPEAGLAVVRLLHGARDLPSLLEGEP